MKRKGQIIVGLALILVFILMALGTFNSSFASLVSEILMILSSSVEYPRTLTLPYQMAVLSMIQAHNDSFGTILMNNP